MQQDTPIHTPAPTPPPPPPPIQPTPIQPAPQTQQSTQIPLVPHAPSPSRVTIHPPSRPPQVSQNARPPIQQQLSGPLNLPTAAQQAPISRQQVTPPQSDLSQQTQSSTLTQSSTSSSLSPPTQQIRVLQNGVGAQPVPQRTQNTQPRPLLASQTSPNLSSGNITTPRPPPPPPPPPPLPLSPVFVLSRPQGTSQTQQSPSQTSRLTHSLPSSQVTSFTSQPNQVAQPSHGPLNSQSLHSSQPLSNSHGRSLQLLPNPNGPQPSSVVQLAQSSQVNQGSQPTQPRVLTASTSRGPFSQSLTPQRQSHLPSLTQQLQSSPSSADSAAKVLEWATSQHRTDEREQNDLPIISLSHYPDDGEEEEAEIIDTKTDIRPGYSDEDSSSKEQEIGFTPHNRGNKLKRRAEALSGGPKLRAPYGYHEDLAHVTSASGKRRHIIHRYPMHADKLLEYSGDEEDNPYKEIIIKDILGPLECPEDMVRRPALARVLKDQKLSKLSDAFMEMVENEHNFNKILTRLYNVLQGDDPMYQDVDFRINPLPETVTTRVSRTEKSEGGSGFGVLNMGLQGNESIKGKRALEAKDDGLEILRDTREKLLTQLDYSGQFLKKMQDARDGIVTAVRQKEKLYKRMRERDRKNREINEPTTASALNALESAPSSSQTAGTRERRRKGKGKVRTK